MIRIGVICPSEIAYRRFMPALLKLTEFQFVGVAVPDQSEWPEADEKTLIGEKNKAKNFMDTYGGKIFDSYTSIIHSNEIDAVYIPLPPALHFHWSQLALKAGKHVLVEKPATPSFANTDVLVQLAAVKNLAFHENYMFAFHQQLATINDIIQSGEIGDVRLYRISFGFPRRAANDFRYNKALGGGALLDAGGYTIKYASMLLGQSAKLVYTQSQFIDEFEVDIAGSAALVNDQGIAVQLAFGMDNSYKCDLEVWGSKGYLLSGRVLTAPAGFAPEVTVKVGNDTTVKSLPEDDAFMKSILHFQQCIEDEGIRKSNYEEIAFQAKLVQQFIDQANL
jgi:dTDP-3,4-didehydro-2,6-dideoxy-alpha-D-glucose 3-reductase